MSWAIITHIDSGPIASRPAANAVPGRHYGWWATDTKVLSISDGSTWTDIGPGGGSGVTFGTPAVVLGTAAAAGSVDEVIRRDSTIVAFDATVPSTQAFGDSAAAGSAAVAARRDHKHAMPATPTSVSGNAGTATALQTGRTIDGQTFDGTADITVIAPGTHAATSKTTPVDADELPLIDSAASNVLKKLTGTNLKAYLKAYFDTIYAATAGAEALLASTYYNPSGGVVTKVATSSLVALDTTNLRATFTAPASGNVIVKCGCRITSATSGGSTMHLGVLEASTTRFTVIVNNGVSIINFGDVAFKITGLTPGNSYSYDLAVVESNYATGTHGNAKYGFSTSNLVDGTGPAFIEVWSAS